MVEFNRVKWPLTQLSPIAFLNINPYKNRKVIPDMERAFSMMSFFFPSADDFFRTEPGREYESHPLINQSERAKHLPVRRYKNSNRTMAKEFWREWDQLRSSGNSIRKYFPSEWNAAIRPIIAHCKEVFARATDSNMSLTLTTSIQRRSLAQLLCPRQQCPSDSIARADREARLLRG